jgi:uncharacterized membrane protein (DUF441 family)
MTVAVKVEPIQVAQVEVTSAWSSKINWAQLVAVSSSVITFLFGGKVGIAPEQQAAIVVVIGMLQGLVTWLAKTWFTPHVHAASLPPGVVVAKGD